MSSSWRKSETELGVVRDHFHGGRMQQAHHIWNPLTRTTLTWTSTLSITTDLHNRCVNMLARLFNAPMEEGECGVGVAGKVGSSEARMLAGLAFKKRWQNMRRAQGKPFDKPNIVIGSNVQVCWEKFARCFEVELKQVKAAIGVKSINVSGHKYGLVYAGIGWVLWRTKQDLPEDLVFHINYLGADQPTFTLNFSKGSSLIIAQYYQLIRLGKEGYRNVMENCRENAMVVKEGIVNTGCFNILSKDNGVPVVAFSLKDRSQHDEFKISAMLRHGWIVPRTRCRLVPTHITVLRVVIRAEFFSHIGRTSCDGHHKCAAST
ncbi:hypothetical protein K1719_028217 [Acacia pycnantha]|nr:hypothetical protein K1719_028217 [Acacia pycnantha]